MFLTEPVCVTVTVTARVLVVATVHWQSWDTQIESGGRSISEEAPGAHLLILESPRGRPARRAGNWYWHGNYYYFPGRQ